MLRPFSQIVFLSFFVLSNCFKVSGQAPARMNSSEIQLALEKMNVLGSVLYIAAHPDDENTRLITWLSKEKLMNTAYLSLTRGDGGQNLIGSEQGELLGVIRTQELLQARKIDGGKQFFTRANDFGFSKNPSETFNFWDREKVLADMVWVIRKFRPDVLITRFSPEPSNTHGHHTASAILAREAFDAAGDSTRFSSQLQWVKVWKPKRLFWNTSFFFFGSKENFDKADKTGWIGVDVGGYSPLLGKSNTEISAESRSMHKSQGFGATGTRGDNVEYLSLLKGDTARADIFEGIDISWSRVKGGQEAGEMLKIALETYKPAKPYESIPVLMQALKFIKELPEGHWRNTKIEELNEIIRSCMGLFMEAVVSAPAASPGDTVKFSIELVNRSPVPVMLETVNFGIAGREFSPKVELKNNVPQVFHPEAAIPENMPYTQPYWLQKEGKAGMNVVDEQEFIGLAENVPPFQVKISLLLYNEPLELVFPVIYKTTDPVEGEVYRPFEITPPVFLNPDNKVNIFTDDQPKTVNVKVRAGKNDVSGKIRLQLPDGWKSDTAEVPFKIAKKGEEISVPFKIYPTHQQSSGVISFSAIIGQLEISRGIHTIRYPHIPDQTVFPSSRAKLVRVELKKKAERIGYIMGAGDQVPLSLEQMGFQVTLIGEDEIVAEKLKGFDAVIVGVRAYNTLEKLKFQNERLLNYVKEGGNLIVQYQTNARLVLEDFAPYRLKLSKDRVTVENSPVNILKPAHPALNTPNKISSADFDNWVQERGLYFAGQWAPEFDALIACGDPGEPALNGGLLIAKYGKGNYIFTGYSWFRQLPAGVPGAMRLFVNLISLGK